MSARQTAYANKTLAGALADISQGSGGFNNALFRVAARIYQLANAGLFDLDDVTDRLADAAIAAGNPRHSVRDTLRSAQRAAERDPLRDGALPDFNGMATPHYEPKAPRADVCEPPSDQWQTCGQAFALFAEQHLWDTAGDGAWDWLWGRGFRDRTIRRARLGFNPTDIVTSRAKWGMEPDLELSHPDMLVLPAGVVIPYVIGGALWKLEVRRLDPRQNQSKYKTIAGSSNTLYNADALRPGFPAVLCEGAFDALAVTQDAEEITAAVACGTTTGARRIRWIAQLGACRPVLVAMDADAGGNDAGAPYWLDVLGKAARRWKPIIDDPAAMLKAGFDIRGWVQEGITQ